MPGFDYTGQHAYHIVVATRARNAVLVDGIAESMLKDVSAACERTGFEPLAFCIMPDHIHLLVLGVAPEASALKFVQRFKQLTGFGFEQRVGHKLWQQSFYDHVLRRTEDINAVARYIVGNPVRADLIEDALEWPYSGGTLLAVDRRDGAKASSLHGVPSAQWRATGDPANEDTRGGDEGAKALPRRAAEPRGVEAFVT